MTDSPFDVPSDRAPCDRAGRPALPGLPAVGALWMGREDDFVFARYSLPADLFDLLRGGVPIPVPVCGRTPDATLPGRLYPTAQAARDALADAIRARAGEPGAAD